MQMRSDVSLVKQLVIPDTFLMTMNGKRTTDVGDEKRQKMMDDGTGTECLEETINSIDRLRGRNDSYSVSEDDDA